MKTHSSFGQKKSSVSCREKVQAAIYSVLFILLAGFYFAGTLTSCDTPVLNEVTEQPEEVLEETSSDSLFPDSCESVDLTVEATNYKSTVNSSSGIVLDVVVPMDYTAELTSLDALIHHVTSRSAADLMPSVAAIPSPYVGTFTANFNGWVSTYNITSSSIEDESMAGKFRVVSTKTYKSVDNYLILLCQVEQGTDYTPVGNYYPVALKYVSDSVAVSPTEEPQETPAQETPAQETPAPEEEPLEIPSQETSDVTEELVETSTESSTSEDSAETSSQETPVVSEDPIEDQNEEISGDSTVNTVTLSNGLTLLEGEDAILVTFNDKTYTMPFCTRVVNMELSMPSGDYRMELEVEEGYWFATTPSDKSPNVVQDYVDSYGDIPRYCYPLVDSYVVMYEFQVCQIEYMGVCASLTAAHYNYDDEEDAVYLDYDIVENMVLTSQDWSLLKEFYSGI